MEYQKNLNRISDLQERRLLRDILNSVLQGLIEYEEEQFHKLEDRVFGELEYQEMRYSIVTTLIAEKDYDPIHDTLFPMQRKDIQKKLPEFSADSSKFSLGQAFLECGYQEVKAITQSNKIYYGVVTTKETEHQIGITLAPCSVYLEQIRLLYETFLQNGIPWVTVNAPYLFKFVEKQVVLAEPPFAEGETFVSVSVDWKELKEIVKEDRIPLWNVETYQAQTMIFPVPVLDGVNYEHLIAKKKGDSESGYLVAVPDKVTCYVKQKEDTITITAPYDTMQRWDLMRIVPAQQGIAYRGAYPMMGNQRKNQFIERLENRGKSVIRTKGELLRLAESFEGSNLVKLVGFEIMEKPPETVETYPVNFFLNDGIREERYKKCMLLEFIRQEDSSILDQDQMSFFVSVIQMSFPEYYCVGKEVTKEEVMKQQTEGEKE